MGLIIEESPSQGFSHHFPYDQIPAKPAGHRASGECLGEWLKREASI